MDNSGIRSFKHFLKTFLFYFLIFISFVIIFSVYMYRCITIYKFTSYYTSNNLAGQRFQADEASHAVQKKEVRSLERNHESPSRPYT